MAELDAEGRVRKAVYLPEKCWAWLESTAERDRSSRNDLLEGLVLLAMDGYGELEAAARAPIPAADKRPGAARAATNSARAVGSGGYMDPKDCPHPIGRRIGKACMACGKDPA